MSSGSNNARMPQLDGNPIWFALPTPDPDGAKAFYSSLFGWEWADVDMGEGNVYHMAVESDANIVGMHNEQSGDFVVGGERTWHNYMYVDDAGKACERVVEHGGEVLRAPSTVKMPGGDDGDYIGITAAVTMPEGAIFRLWQSGSGKGADVFAEPGAVCWIEYHSNDVEAAMEFYTKVFAVEFTEVSMPSVDGDSDDFRLNLLTIGGEQMSCAFFQMSSEWSKQYPAMWATYFMVDDVRVSADKAVDLGAELAMPPTRVPPGTLAALKDPQGVHFSLWQESGSEARLTSMQ